MSDEKREIDLDLNHRERARFAQQAEEMSENFKKLAKSFREEEDSKIMVNYLICSFGGASFMKELHSIIKEFTDREEIRKALK